MMLKVNSPCNFRDKDYKVVKIFDGTIVLKPKDKSESNVVIHGKFLKELHKGHKRGK